MLRRIALASALALAVIGCSKTYVVENPSPQAQSAPAPTVIRTERTVYQRPAPRPAEPEINVVTYNVEADERYP